MDYAACNVVYVDRAARGDRLVKRKDLLSTALSSSPLNHVEEHELLPGYAALSDNLQALLGMFSEGLCSFFFPGIEPG
jgi:3',5'-cyclic-nucleotide phosphodiesterase